MINPFPSAVAVAVAGIVVLPVLSVTFTEVTSSFRLVGVSVNANFFSFAMFAGTDTVIRYGTLSPTL